MYSRNTNRNQMPPHVPEHYSGWAFRPQSPTESDRPPRKKPTDGYSPAAESPEKDVNNRPQAIGRPSPPKNPPPPPSPPCLPPPAPHEPPHCDPVPPPMFPSSLRQLFSGGSLSHSFGLDFEELLLIGLIFLLGGNGEDNELPLLLALLLLCG